MNIHTRAVYRVTRWLGFGLLLLGMVGFAVWWYGSDDPDPATVASPGAPSAVDARSAEGEVGGPADAAPAVGDSPGNGSTVPDREVALDLYRAGRIEEAAGALSAYLEARPDDAEVAAALAQIQWLRGDAASSSARYEAVIAQNGADPELLYQLALVLRSDGRLVESIEDLGAALRLRPQATEFRVELARTLRMAGAGERAMAEWETVIAALPAGDQALPGCYYELGLSCLAAGDAAAAKAAFEKGAALRPGDPAFAAQLDALSSPEAGS